MTTLPTVGPMTGPQRPPDTLRMTPGRWVALLFGMPLALALIGWTSFSFVALIGQASFPVNGAIALQHGELLASTNGADVTLHQDQAAGNTARLTGKVQYSLVRPQFSLLGTDVSLHCRIFTGNCGLSATLGVPADTPVDLNSGGGNVQVNGIQKAVTLNTDGGDVTVSGTGSSSTVLLTGGGNVNASDLGGNLQFVTDGGDVNVNDLFAPQVKLDTGGGNISLVFTAVPENLTIQSSGGDVTVVLPHSTTRYAISYTTSGGDYSAPVPTDSASHNTINVSSGGGNVSIIEAS